MRSNDENMISVEINRFGSDNFTVTVPEDSTLEDVLEKADITLGESETAWVNGVQGSTGSLMDDGDTIQLVGKKEGGR